MPFVYNSAKGIIMSNTLDRLIGSFVGLAVGDAVGAAVEFKPRGTFPLVTDMLGGGPFRLPVGYWTDDTSMAVCLAESLLHDPNLDADDLLVRFCDWYNYGTNSSTGRCFDIGNTTVRALEQFMRKRTLENNPESYCAGNGSIMRLAPASILYYNDSDKAASIAELQGKTTHASPVATAACSVLSKILTTCYTATDKTEILDIEIDASIPAEISKALDKNIANKKETEIRSTGYSAHTLEAAVWCFLTTDNFRDAVLKATNLGDDTDTVAAVTGQIAGAFYGESEIPNEWIRKLYEYDRIKQLAIQLSEKGKDTVSGH